MPVVSREKRMTDALSLFSCTVRHVSDPFGSDRSFDMPERRTLGRRCRLAGLSQKSNALALRSAAVNAVEPASTGRSRLGIRSSFLSTNRLSNMSFVQQLGPLTRCASTQIGTVRWRQVRDGRSSSDSPAGPSLVRGTCRVVAHRRLLIRGHEPPKTGSDPLLRLVLTSAP